MNTQFWFCIMLMVLAFGLVLIDWYCMHCKYAFSNVPNLVNRVFTFFCLAMLTGNVIMVSKADYTNSLYLSSVVILTELVFLVSNKVKV